MAQTRNSKKQPKAIAPPSRCRPLSNRSATSCAAPIREKEKAAKDLETKAAGIDAAVFDLKAVNPHAVAKADERTPQEMIDSIAQQGRIVSEALMRLSVLL